MSRKGLVPALLTTLAVVAACTGKGVEPSVTIHPTTRPVSPSPVASPSTGGAVSPSPVATPTPTTAPTASASADTAASGPAPTPPIFHPSQAPTSLPEGHVSPLPSNAFPTDPPTPVPTTPAQATPTPVATPVVTPTPGSPASMVVVSNNLDVGSGSIGGVVFGPPSTPGGEPVTVGGGTINIVEQADQTKRAVLTVGADGTYRLGALALTTYLVWITKQGYTADTAPTEVTLSIGSNQNSNTPLVLVQTVPFPSAQ